MATVVVRVDPPLALQMCDEIDRLRAERARLRWEADWLDVTGLRWGRPYPRLARLDVTLDSRWPALSQVRIVGTDMQLPCVSMSIDVDLHNGPTITLTMPLHDADVMVRS